VIHAWFSEAGYLRSLLSLMLSFHHREEELVARMSSLPSPVVTRTAGQTSVKVLAVAAAIALLYYGHVFFITVLIAIIIAFLLDPIVTVFVKLRLPRAVASFIVCSIALLVLYLFGLGLYTQFSGFVEELPAYSQRMNEMVDNIATQVDQIEKQTYQTMVPKRFQEKEPPPAEYDSGSSYSSRADPDSALHLWLLTFLLRRRTHGELRSVPGLFHAELARSYAP
jgi:ABC-type multidrug transport system fused ATPase/permease subunit